ncbi:TPA: hypothetical protein DIV48_02045 [Candidatus Kaiserbacteria bacterium]|nr:MAG: hypothetical protein UY93_C0001G0066 [Parcubacteria group bacterium GW2011_GWA1_56_13]KKW46952.1 MAG: hypothetical protein UY97_C0001G0009 [Parcubacteria group bacterium GW2011_GWB1_57_6]HCR52412.1 hypothetical protein [Candidatus Kaiserbacteria bacterium]
MSAVIHRVLLADLKGLAEIWEIPNGNLGLEINAEGNLVPRLIDEEDGVASLSQMLEVAERDFPDNDILDLVVQIYESRGGNRMKLSTVNYICSAEGRACKSRWWTFTDDYKNRMH